MKESLHRILQVFEEDLPQGPAALLRSAMTGLLLLSPFQPDHPLASLLLPVLLLLLGQLRGIAGLRAALACCLAALLLSLFAVEGWSTPAIGLLQALGACFLLPVWLKEADLPPRDLEPRPGVGRVLLPFHSPVLLGAAFWLPLQPAGTLLTVLESAQIISLICALAIWLTIPRPLGPATLLLCAGKSLSTLLIPWWLLHGNEFRLWAWLLALLFLLEGEWESRILGRLAAKAEKPC